MNTTMHTLPELKEQATHGDIFLPLQEYSCELQSGFPSVPLHWHEEMELTRITKGQAHYQIGSADFDVHAGDLILIPPHILHHVTQIDRAYMHSETFVFHLNFLLGNSTDACSLKYLKPILDGALQFPCFFPAGTQDQLDKLFSRLYHCYQEKAFGYELLLKSYFFDLFRYLFEQNMITVSETATLKTSQSEKLKEILQYMELHFSEELSISEIAAFCHLSESYLMHFFRENTGMTITEYLNNYRLRQATELLKLGNRTILDIAMCCGFNNISYFHKRFKEYYGMTPKKYIATSHLL